LKLPLSVLRHTCQKYVIMWASSLTIMVLIIYIDINYINHRHGWSLMQMATGRPDILLLFATTSAAVHAATALTVWGGF
jgi:hypothetical protein